MKSIRRIFFYFILIAVLVFWTIFTIDNPTTLVFDFLGWQSLSLPVSIWLLVAFVIGGVCGILLCASGYFHGRATQRQLQLELDRSRDALVETSSEVEPQPPQANQRPMGSVQPPPTARE